MSLFGKFFSRNNQKQNGNPFPTRPLKLQHTISPENGERFARQFYEAVKNIEKIELDYSPSSIEFVDNFLQRFKDKGLTVDQFAETIFTAGCYVGQVFVTNNSAYWIRKEDGLLPNGIQMSEIIVKVDEKTVCDPISKSFKRFYYGDIDNLAYFYSVFT
jgi:hypothetical protein